MKNQVKNYVGGAGPSEELVSHNNKVLARELKKLGILFVRDTDFLEELTGVKQTPLLKITHPRTGSVAYAGYDRWGFVVDGVEDFIDQCSIEKTITAIQKWYK